MFGPINDGGLRKYAPEAPAFVRYEPVITWPYSLISSKKLASLPHTGQMKSAGSSSPS